MILSQKDESIAAYINYSLKSKSGEVLFPSVTFVCSTFVQPLDQIAPAAAAVSLKIFSLQDTHKNMVSIRQRTNVFTTLGFLAVFIAFQSPYRNRINGKMDPANRNDTERYQFKTVFRFFNRVLLGLRRVRHGFYLKIFLTF